MQLSPVLFLQDALLAIKGGQIPSERMPSFEEMKEILGFNSYYEEEEKYAAAASLPSPGGMEFFHP